MGFLDIILLQQFDTQALLIVWERCSCCCKDAEVYHQLKKIISTFHCLPSQLAAQLTFELLLHHVFDCEKGVHQLILTTSHDY